MALPKIQKGLKDYLNNISSFEKLWHEKCAKYDIDSQPSVLPAVERIIVIGDIHGDSKMLEKVLRIAKVINKKGEWTGGETVVVQVGDQVDRCRYSGIPCSQKEATNPDEGNDWKILQYFTELHKKAREHGGAVYSLLGNHELMNIRGDFRYVSYEGIKEFDDFKYKDNDGNMVRLKRDDGTEITDGSEARKMAFSPGNHISEFLACTRQMALVIGSNLFAHAGVLPSIAEKYSITNLNQLMSLYLFNILENASEYKDMIEAYDSSPLWNRVIGNMGIEKYKNRAHDSEETNEKCDKLLEPLKEVYKVGKMYVGHTPLLENGIGNVCDGRIWLTDAGLSQAFNKFRNKNTSVNEYISQAQILEILKDGKEINILK